MRYFVFLLFAQFQFNICAQGSLVTADYAAEYDFKCVIDTSQNKLSKHSYTFLLSHYNGTSRFISANTQFNDSMTMIYAIANPQYVNPTKENIQEAVDHFSENMSTWIKFARISYKVEKDFEAQISKINLNYAFPPKHLEASLTFDWQISEEQDSIVGLLCYKATTQYGGRSYTAWFAPSIPIPDGPYVFAGLPGLIIKISDERNWYTFQLKNITTSPQTRFWKEYFIIDQSQKLSRKEYVDKSRNFKNNPRIGGVRNVSEEKLLELKKRHKHSFYMLIESYKD